MKSQTNAWNWQRLVEAKVDRKRYDLRAIQLRVHTSKFLGNLPGSPLTDPRQGLKATVLVEEIYYWDIWLHSRDEDLWWGSYMIIRFPGDSVVKNPPAMQESKDLWVEISWRRAWQPVPVFSPGGAHGQRSLADYRIRRNWATEFFTTCTTWEALLLRLPLMSAFCKDCLECSAPGIHEWVFKGKIQGLLGMGRGHWEPTQLCLKLWECA